MLDAFDIKKPAHLIGHCGGGALAIRTITEFPERFSLNHILHNSITSEIPPTLSKILTDYNIHLLVTWIEDGDHLKCCVAYKAFRLMRKNHFKHIKLVDIDNDFLGAVLAPGQGRGTNSVFVFTPSQSYISQVLSFLKQRQ